MDLYGEKKNAIRTVGFLCAILLVLSIADLLPEEYVSLGKERKTEALVPLPVKGAVQNGTFMEAYEDYVLEDFVSRENWKAFRTHMDVLRGVREVNGVYLGKDDYLIEKHLEKDFAPEIVDKRLGYMQILVKEFPQVKLMPVPTADNILSEKLPAFAPFYDQRLLLQQMKNVLGEERIIDIYDILKEHAEEELYYRTDREWTSLGAYYGYQAFAKTYHLPAAAYLKQGPEKVTGDFRGGLHNKVGIASKAEDILMFPTTLDKKYTITYDDGKITNSFYEPAYLEREDKLGYFLDGRHGVTEIERESFSKRKLFVIKDGFGSHMIPLLARHYKTVYVVDLSCYNDKLIEFMKECDTNGDMDVLVLYDCVTFVERFQFQ